MYRRVKSFTEAHCNEANCFTIRVNVIQVAVDPMLN